MGADVYVNSSNPDEMKNAEYTLDCLIVTINAAVDWTPYLAAMRANGAFVVLGAIPQPLEFPAFTLLMKNVSIQPTNIELEARAVLLSLIIDNAYVIIDTFIFQLIVAGSNIGGSENINEMLQFVAEHPDCQPLIETMPMEKINEAIERVKNNQVRFRMVVEN